ncbi:MAG: SpoIIE family protein phosphatase, partial [Lachnospiraceae bacterium]|nr:SpoIIE family protein phosphatase [Lachnospiraceae bacterium]
DGINYTVRKLNEFRKKEASRLDADLKIAQSLQKESLPDKFPPFPERGDFGLYAAVSAAETVCGDFYDYYLLTDNRLVFMTADISGIGLPAAMFMMRAKTMIKSYAVSGLTVDETVKRTNRELLKDNEAGMFMTLFIGIIDLDVGEIEYVNSGKKDPFVIRSGEVCYLSHREDLSNGTDNGSGYIPDKISLKPDEAIFLYTTGLTEALGGDGAGDKRLKEILAAADISTECVDPNEYCEQICHAVRAEVAKYTLESDISVDMTMLCLKYRGGYQA